MRRFLYQGAFLHRKRVHYYGNVSLLWRRFLSSLATLLSHGFHLCLALGLGPRILFLLLQCVSLLVDANFGCFSARVMSWLGEDLLLPCSPPEPRLLLSQPRPPPRPLVFPLPVLTIVCGGASSTLQNCAKAFYGTLHRTSTQNRRLKLHAGSKRLSLTLGMCLALARILL